MLRGREGERERERERERWEKEREKETMGKLVGSRSTTTILNLAVLGYTYAEPNSNLFLTNTYHQEYINVLLIPSIKLCK